MEPRKKLSSELNLVIEHSEKIKTIEITMGGLLITIERSDSTVKNASRLKTSPLSPQLKAAIVELAELYINPRFYNIPNYTAKRTGTKIAYARLAAGRRHNPAK